MFIKFSNPILRQYAVIIAANLTIVSLGLNVVWGSPMLVKLRDEDQTVLPRPLTQQEEGLVVSLGNLTGMAAVFYAGFAMDNIGRKWTILACFFPKLIMSFFVIFANDVWMLYVGRIFAGQSDMTLIAVVSTYSSEASGKEIRGASGAMMQIMSAIGMLIMLGIGPFVSYIAINVIMACVVVAVFIPTLFIPESPYFLYMKGKTDKAIEVLTVLRGSEALAHEEIKQYSNTVEPVKPTGSNEDTKTPNFNKWALLKDRTVIKAAGIILFLSIAMQLSGYNALNLYLQSIFDAANTSVSSEISSLIIGCIQLLACVVTFSITDRFGRKPILCTSMAAMAIGMIGLGIFFLLVNGKDEVTGFLNYLPLISIAIVVYGFNAGMGSLFWMLVAELLDGPIRSYGVTTAVVISIVTMFCLTYLFPVILASGGATIYWVFAGFCVATGLFIGFVVPETKGKTFVEIQRALGRRDVNETVVKGSPS